MKPIKKTIILALISANCLLASPAFAAGSADGVTAMLMNNLSNGVVAVTNTISNTFSSISSFFTSSTSSQSQSQFTPSGNGEISLGNREIDITRSRIINSIDISQDTAAYEDIRKRKCDDLNASSKEHSDAYVQRHMAPSPVSIIKNTTCFIDIFSIPIPSTGFGFVDALVGQVVGFIKNAVCKSTGSFWGQITSAAMSGNVSGLINAGVTATKDAGANYTKETFATLTASPSKAMPSPTPPAGPAKFSPHPPPVIPTPNGGWGNYASGYAMCGNVVLITEDVSATYTQTNGVSPTSYYQSMMTRGLGYSLSFTTGPDVSTTFYAQQQPSSIITSIDAAIVNQGAGKILQKMVVSTKNCDFNGDVNLSDISFSPSLQYIVSSGAVRTQPGIATLLPNTTYYLNYLDFDGTNYTCPNGASCDFNINFTNTNPIDPNFNGGN